MSCAEEVSWPAGALEEQEYEQQVELTREQVEMEQELQEKQTSDRYRYHTVHRYIDRRLIRPESIGTFFTQLSAAEMCSCTSYLANTIF